jgi:hypothetical protein
LVQRRRSRELAAFPIGCGVSLAGAGGTLLVAFVAWQRAGAGAAAGTAIFGGKSVARKDINVCTWLEWVISFV